MSQSCILGSLPPSPLAVSWGGITNPAQFGPSSSNMDRFYSIGIQSKIPAASLNKNLPKNLRLAIVKVNLSLDNREFYNSEQALAAELPRLDFRFGIKCGHGQMFKDFLTHVTAKVYLLTGERAVVFEGEISWNVFSPTEISNGGMRMIVTQFQSVHGGGKICPVDTLLSIAQSTPSAETGLKYDAAQQTRLNILETSLVKTEVEHKHFRHNIVGDTNLPLDLSLPKDAKPDGASPSFTTNHVATQTEISSFDTGSSNQTRDASTQTHYRLVSCKLIDPACIPGGLKKVLKRLRPVASNRNSQREHRLTRHHLASALDRLGSKLAEF